MIIPFFLGGCFHSEGGSLLPKFIPLAEHAPEGLGCEASVACIRASMWCVCVCVIFCESMFAGACNLQGTLCCHNSQGRFTLVG